MPSVPMAPEELAPQAIPGVRVSPDSNIAGFGGFDRFTPNPFHATQALSADVIQMAETEKAKADDVATTAAHTQLINLKNQLIYDPQNGAYTKKGVDAFGVTEQYGQKFQDGADAIASSLHNDQQRAVFDKMRQNYGSELNGELERHTLQQSQIAQKDTLNAGVEAARNDAILNYQNPGKIGQSLMIQQSLLDAFGPSNGIHPGSDQYKLMQGDLANKTHEAVIARMMDNGQDMVAKNYFESVKDQMSGPDLSKTEKLVEEGSLRGQSQRTVDDMMDRNLSSSAAQAEMRNIDDPKLRDEVSTRFRQQMMEKKQAENEAYSQQYNQAAQLLTQSKGQAPIPDSMRLGLSPEDNTKLDNYAHHLRLGVEPVTDWNVYYDLKTQAADPKMQNDFMKENIMDHVNELARPQLKELMDLQTSLHKQDGKADPLLNGFTTNQEIVNDTLKDMGVNPSAKSGSEATKVNQFRQMVDQQIIQHQQATGKKASTQDVQSIVDTLSQKVVKDRGWFWDTNARLYEMPTGSTFEVNAKDIPRTDRIQIEDALKRNNIPVTDKTVTDLYQRKLQGMTNGK